MTRKMLRGIHNPMIVRWKPTGAIEAIEYRPGQLDARYEVIVGFSDASMILNDKELLHPMKRLNRLIDDTLKKRSQ